MDTDSGNWVFQLSVKNPNGMLVNMRGRTAEEVGTAITLWKKYGKVFGFDVENPANNKEPERKQGGGGWKGKSSGGAATTNRSVAPVSHEGAKKIGDNVYAISVNVKTVFDGQPSKNNPDVNRPGTVIGTNDQRYNTFDTDLLEIARLAKTTGKQVAITYEYNEKYKSNNITEDGLVIVGAEDNASDGETDGEEQSAADGY